MPALGLEQLEPRTPCAADLWAFPVVAPPTLDVRPAVIAAAVDESRGTSVDSPITEPIAPGEDDVALLTPAAQGDSTADGLAPSWLSWDAKWSEAEPLLARRATDGPWHAGHERRGAPPTTIEPESDSPTPATGQGFTAGAIRFSLELSGETPSVEHPLGLRLDVDGDGRLEWVVVCDDLLLVDHNHNGRWDDQDMLAWKGAQGASPRIDLILDEPLGHQEGELFALRPVDGGRLF